MPGAVEGMEGVFIAGGRLSAHEALGRLDSLVLRVRSGDIEAFDEIMLETEGRVLALAWKLLGDKEQAKDACQDAFLRAFKSLGSYRLGESFPAWIGRIVANVCFDQLKMKKREMIQDDSGMLDSAPCTDSEGAEEMVLMNQRRELVQRALVTLSPSERSALILRDIEGLTTTEAAITLGLRAGSVRANISQARRKVKDFCQQLLHKPSTDKGGGR